MHKDIPFTATLFTPDFASEARVPNLDSRRIIVLNVYLVCLIHEKFNEGMVLQEG